MLVTVETQSGRTIGVYKNCDAFIKSFYEVDGYKEQWTEKEEENNLYYSRYGNINIILWDSYMIVNQIKIDIGTRTDHEGYDVQSELLADIVEDITNDETFLQFQKLEKYLNNKYKENECE